MSFSDLGNIGTGFMIGRACKWCCNWFVVEEEEEEERWLWVVR